MVLEDHRREGKRFVPPMMQLGPLEETSWVDRILPELLWIGALNERYGLRRGAKICATLAELGQERLEASGAKTFLCRTSHWQVFSNDERAHILRELQERALLDDLSSAMAPFIAAYPRSPMAFLVAGAEAPETPVAQMRSLVSLLFDRWGVPATWVQVHAVYMMFAQDRLKVHSDTALANFPAVEAYPETEESKRIASGCRATVNVFFGKAGSDGLDDWWPEYFWNRGLELEPCSPLNPYEAVDER